MLWSDAVTSTASTDFPTTSGAYDPGPLKGTHDGFVSVLDATGSKLSWSTFLGGRSSSRIRLIDKKTLRQRTAQDRGHDRIRLIKGLGHHRFDLSHLSQHVEVLGTLSGKQHGHPVR